MNKEDLTAMSLRCEKKEVTILWDPMVMAYVARDSMVRLICQRDRHEDVIGYAVAIVMGISGFPDKSEEYRKHMVAIGELIEAFRKNEMKPLKVTFWISHLGLERIDYEIDPEETSL